MAELGTRCAEGHVPGFAGVTGTNGDSMMRIRKGFAAALAGAAITLGACRDQGPDAKAVPELYVLESIGGLPLPLQLSDPGARGSYVTIHGGRIRLAVEGDEGNVAGPQRLRLETNARIVRRDADGDETVVAEGESSETYFFERDELAIIPYRIERGDRVDAPFHLEVQGSALVMHSDQDALRNWRFIR